MEDTGTSTSTDLSESELELGSCNICGKVMQPGEASGHAARHESHPLFECNTCGAIIESYHLFLQHLKTHCLIKRKALICPWCQTFVKREAMPEHLQICCNAENPHNADIQSHTQDVVDRVLARVCHSEQSVEDIVENARNGKKTIAKNDEPYPPRDEEEVGENDDEGAGINVDSSCEAILPGSISESENQMWNICFDESGEQEDSATYLPNAFHNNTQSQKPTTSTSPEQMLQHKMQLDHGFVCKDCGKLLNENQYELHVAPSMCLHCSLVFTCAAAMEHHLRQLTDTDARIPQVVTRPSVICKASPNEFAQEYAIFTQERKVNLNSSNYSTPSPNSSPPHSDSDSQLAQNVSIDLPVAVNDTTADLSQQDMNAEIFTDKSLSFPSGDRKRKTQEEKRMTSLTQSVIGIIKKIKKGPVDLKDKLEKAKEELCPVEDPRFACSICRLAFDTQLEVIHHIKSHVSKPGASVRLLESILSPKRKSTAAGTTPEMYSATS